jgi:hypothetical protein
MYNGLLHTHNLLRWIILLLLLFALFRSLVDRNGEFTTGHQKIGLFLTICCDIMLVLGLYQWIAGSWGLKSIRTNGMSEVMKNPVLRFFAVEHLIGMLIAIILVHIGYSYSKKDISDGVKHRRTLLFYGLALLIILISIPWPFRLVGAGRPWFPGL